METRTTTIFKKEILFNFINEWGQLIGKYNWITFTLINIEFENDIHLGGFEIMVIIFGLGFRVRINYKETEMLKELNKRIDSISELDLK